MRKPKKEAPVFTERDGRLYANGLPAFVYKFSEDKDDEVPARMVFTTLAEAKGKTVWWKLGGFGPAEYYDMPADPQPGETP